MIEFLKLLKDFLIKFLTPERVAQVKGYLAHSVFKRPVVSIIEGYPETLTVTGAYPYYTSGKKHVGIDFACKKGAKFFSPCKGTVTYTCKGKKGTHKESTVIIQPKGKKFYIVFKHCLPSVKKGDKVKKKDKIGIADNSGDWGGYHLHFAVKNIKKKYIEPLTKLHSVNPGQMYKVLKKKYRGRKFKSVGEIFQKHNPEAWKIINRKK